MAFKFKLFWWKALHNIFPTGVKLRDKMFSVDGCCQVCGHVNETVGHVLFGCSFSLQTWDLIGLPRLVNIYDIMDYLQAWFV